MKLEYNILWIDNDLQSYIDNGSVQSISDFLIERGFEPTIEKVFDEADLDKYITRHNYDLIISDYNLENTTGDLIIEDIRKTRQLDTEILFYTAQDSYKNRPEVKERLAFIERLTFQVGRDTLLDKIEKVIELTLKKLLELNATRGLITAATSHLDIEIEEIIQLLIKKKSVPPEVLDGFVKSKVYDPLEKRLTNFWEKYDGFINLLQKIDAIKKWEIMRELLKPYNEDETIRIFLDNNKSYQDEVIDIRNKFAHAKAIEVEGRLVLKGQIEGKDFEFNEESCIKVRQNLIRHKRNIEALKQFIIN